MLARTLPVPGATFHPIVSCHSSSSHTIPELQMSSVPHIGSHSLQALAASGKLGKLKVDDLKPYLKANGLKVTGKKDELIERITAHVNSQP